MLKITNEMAAHRDRWIAEQRAKGWRSEYRAVYAYARIGVDWERSDAPPDDLGAYMRAWWEASRYIHGGLAPEDVFEEVYGVPYRGD